MNYWLNIHYPPLLRDKPTPSSQAPNWYNHVFLPDGREAAGDDLDAEDYIFIYETKTGRPRADREPYCEGMQGIIALVRAQGPILERRSDPEVYADGTSTDWKWQAPTQTLEWGCCSRQDVCEALSYSQNWTLHGFGDLHSGLKKLTPDEYEGLLRRFRSRI